MDAFDATQQEAAEAAAAAATQQAHPLTQAAALAAAPPAPAVPAVVAPSGGAGASGGPEGDGGGEPPPPELTPEQARVLELVAAGRSVFFTGGAGTGKSTVQRAILKALKEKYGGGFEARVAVTAPTGVAATHIDGTTYHSRLGLRAPHILDDFRSLWGRKEGTRALRVLVLDEVSMVSAECFEALERTARPKE